MSDSDPQPLRESTMRRAGVALGNDRLHKTMNWTTLLGVAGTAVLGYVADANRGETQDKIASGPVPKGGRMTTPANSPTSLREALYELAVSKETPDADLLEECVRRYPEYAAELTAFAVEWALDGREVPEGETLADAAATAISPAVSRAMSRFQNRLHAVRTAAAASTEARATGTVNPFASLDRNGIRGLVEPLCVDRRAAWRGFP